MKIRVTSTTVQNACVMAVCVWALTPQLAYDEAARLMSLGAVTFWILVEAWRHKGIIWAPTLPVLMVLVYAIYTIFFEVLTRGASGVISNIQLYIMLFFLLAQQARRNAMESLYPVFWLVIGLNAIWMTSTLTFLSTVDARAMRMLVRSTVAAEELIEQGVGGYSMAYGAVLLLPVLTLLSLRPGLIDRLQPPGFLTVFPLLPKITVWYLTAICIVLVVKSQFSTAVMAMTVVLMATLFLWKLSSLRLLVTVFSAILLLFFGKALLIELLVVLRPFAEGTNYFLKVNDLLLSLQSGGAAGTAGDRIDRYMRSVALFAGSPIWGVLYFTDIGKHSTLLDGFARWGAVFGAILVYLVTFVQVRALRAFSSVPGGAGAAIGSLVAVLLVFGLNKHFMTAGITIFIVYPTVFHVLQGTRTTAATALEKGVVHA